MGKTKKKGGEWFTKKEVTTPLQILNKLLELPKDKELEFNPLVDTPPGDATSSSDATTSSSDATTSSSDTTTSSSDTTTSSSDGLPAVSDGSNPGSSKKDSTSTPLDVPITFEDIDESSQDYIRKIIPQLNEIYTIIVSPKKTDIEDNTVQVTILNQEADKKVIESVTNIYVPEYIAPITSVP
jgi:hypothetical protein